MGLRTLKHLTLFTNLRILTGCPAFLRGQFYLMNFKVFTKHKKTVRAEPVETQMARIKDLDKLSPNGNFENIFQRVGLKT